MQATQKADHRADLAALPSDWRLVRVDGNKRPIAGDGWFDHDNFSPDDALELNGSGPPAWGLKSGPESGVVVLDLDAEGWRESFEAETGHPITDLPRTIAWSSGKPGRSGRAFQVDPDWWPYLCNRRSWRNANGETAWELRGDRHQAVIIGKHPETGAYRWLPGCSPQDCPDPAPAPEWLLELLLVQELPHVETVTPAAGDANRAAAMLQVLPAADFTSYSDWLRIGMALHHTDAGLLAQWVDWCRQMPNFDEAECIRKWQSFGKGHKGRPATIATLHDLAKRYGYKEPKRKRKHRQEPAAAAPSDGVTITAAGGRRARLAPDDVLSLLPQRVGRLRLNVRTGEVHSPAGVLSGNQISRLYLELSSVAETWPKDATTDAVMLLASRDQFDPVKDWLEGLEAEPLPMEQWQRLDRHLLGLDGEESDPIAASFLPRFFVSAIARTMDPGCSYRESPVLIGPEHRGKTLLGQILFGADHWVEGVGRLDRDALQRIRMAWGVELGELNGITRRADQESLKAFLTERVDTYRAPYDRTPESHPRRFVFWGTSNHPPLRDSGANTRYVCIPIPDRMLPLDWAIEHREALWARALEQYRAGVQWDRITEQQRIELRERNSDFRELDPWADAIAAHLAAALKADKETPAAGSIPVKVERLLDHLSVPKERQNSAMALRVRQIAEQLGWQHGRRRWNGSTPKAGLFPPSEPVHPVHPVHPSVHPPCTPLDPNQRNGSDPAVHPVHPFTGKGSTKRGEQQESPTAATAPVEQPHISQRLVGVLGCTGCTPDQTDSSTSDLPVHGGVHRGVHRGVHTPARIACLVDGEPGWSRRAGPMPRLSVVVAHNDGRQLSADPRRVTDAA